jgi:hypothetical protein
VNFDKRKYGEGKIISSPIFLYKEIKGELL